MQYYSLDTQPALARWEHILRAAAARSEHPEVRTVLNQTVLKLVVQLAAKDISALLPLPELTELSPLDLLAIQEAGHKHPLRSTRTDLEDIFLALGSHSLPTRTADRNEPIRRRLEFLQQRFEASGVLYAAYEGVPPAKRAASDSLSSYALLGWSTLMASSQQPADELYFLNTALKVRDLLVGLYQQLIQLDETLLGYTFVLTCNHALDELYDSRGFRLPAA